MNLKCLTVCQPYAWLIGVGFKPCENRPYPILRPLQGQDLAIHAGLSDAWFTDDAWGLVRHACSRLNLPAMTPRDFPRGVVTCVVRVSAVVRVDVALRHFHRLIREGAPHAGDHLMHVGGPWVALLDQVRVLPCPVKVRGQRGVYLLSREEEAAVAEQVRAGRAGGNTALESGATSGATGGGGE